MVIEVIIVAGLLMLAAIGFILLLVTSLKGDLEELERWKSAWGTEQHELDDRLDKIVTKMNQEEETRNGTTKNKSTTSKTRGKTKRG